MKTSPRLLRALLLMPLGLANRASACGSGPHLHLKPLAQGRVSPPADLSSHFIVAADFVLFFVVVFFLASFLRRGEPVKFAERF